LKIAIIGKGNVGMALGTGLKRAGHEIRYGHRDPKESVLAAAEWGEIGIIAVPYQSLKNVANEVSSAFDDKTVIDVTNVFEDESASRVSSSISAAEELQGLLPRARIVKAFNTVFSRNQSTGKLGKEKLSAFIAADDPDAKQTIMQIAKDIGFEPVDAGPLRNARHLECMAVLIISMAFTLNMGTKIGFKLLRE
jgi:predicted dinucleotide-binding enzyme